MHDMKERLSLFWLFALLNYLYADVLALWDVVGSLNVADAAHIALDDRNFNVVDAGKEQAFPLFLRAFFEGQFEVGVLGANEPGKLVKRRKLFVF